MSHEVRKPLFKRGALARRAKDENGARIFVPWQVGLQCQMSPLSISLETLFFYVMQADGDQAVQACCMLLNQFYRVDRIERAKAAGELDDGYPKPVGMAAARQITDKEFASRWKQAVHERKEILFAGEKSDPLAYHIRKSSDRKIIIT